MFVEKKKTVITDFQKITRAITRVVKYCFWESAFS